MCEEEGLSQEHISLPDKDACVNTPAWGMLCKQVVFVVFWFSLLSALAAIILHRSTVMPFSLRAQERRKGLSVMHLCFFLKVKTGKEDGVVFLCSAYFCVYYICLYTYIHIYVKEHVGCSNFFLCIPYWLVSTLPLECKGSFHICNS